MDQYAELAYRLTLLEIQTRAYFLQEAGKPLRLKCEAELYGPYAPNLNKVLEVLEGHFIRGYGDSQRPDGEVERMLGARDTANGFHRGHPGLQERLGRVSRLISGFETPYGMKLLLSVNWAAIHAEDPAVDEDAAIRFVAAWNDRKRGIFQPARIRVAWERLRTGEWVASA